MTGKKIVLMFAWLITASQAWGGRAASIPILTDAEAWKKMPHAEEGNGQRLPVWIRALAVSLP